jgi:hypothetical protein
VCRVVSPDALRFDLLRVPRGLLPAPVYFLVRTEQGLDWVLGSPEDRISASAARGALSPFVFCSSLLTFLEQLVAGQSVVWLKHAPAGRTFPRHNGNNVDTGRRERRRDLGELIPRTPPAPSDASSA